MGEGKRRQALGLETQTVRLPALTRDEVRLIHDLMHHRLHELQAVPPEQADERQQALLSALRALHHKLFAH
jgi:hypothetical protein